MIRTLYLSAACAVALSGCASFAQSPAAVQANVGAAVSDTQSVASGAVTIAGDIAKAALALTAPLTSVLTTFGGLAVKL